MLTTISFKKFLLFSLFALASAIQSEFKKIRLSNSRNIWA
jgi:hypothetical protein